MQSYRTKYLLMKIAQFVDLPIRATKKPASIKEYEKLEIEHILPNKPKDDLKADFLKNNTGADYDNCKIQLGNLTLLEKALNIVAGNDWFDKKCALYKLSKNYITQSIAEIVTFGKTTMVNDINQYLKLFYNPPNDVQWDVSKISTRQQMLVDLVFQIWKLDTI